MSKIDFDKMDWGSLTNQFKRSKIPDIADLKEFSNYIEKHPEKFHTKTLKRARFYNNVISKKGGSLNPLVPFHTLEYGKVVGSHSTTTPVKRYSRPYRKKKYPPNYMNPWIAFVKAFAAKHSLKYSDAIKDPRCKAEYQKSKSGKGMSDDESEGDMSKTHQGEKDYTTKKGDKDYHIQHHLVAGTPYTKKLGKGNSMVDKFISNAYNQTQLGANAGRKFLSL